MFDTFHEIIGAIKRNMMRTIATGFAVASGLFLIIVLQGAGNGIIHSFEYNMSGFSFDAVHVFGGITTMPYEGVKEGRFIKLDERDLNMVRKSFPQYVNDVMPRLSQGGLTVSNEGNHISSCELLGIYPEYEKVMAVKVLRGRFINKIDLEQKRKVAVIGNKNAKSLYKHGKDPLGAMVNINGISYQVVGVFESDEMSSANTLYAPYTTVGTIFNRGKFIDELTMTVKNIDSEETMEKFESEYVRATSYIHTFNPEDRRALWIWNQAEDSITMHKTQNILHVSFWILGLLTLISGVVGVSNIMLISVKERTREFGIRRAVGARPWSIIRMVVLESVAITGIFGYIGMLIGIFFCEYMDYSVGGQTMDMGVWQAKYFLDPTVDLSTCLTATVIIVIAGALAGIFPAMNAVKVKPIDALRA